MKGLVVECGRFVRRVVSAAAHMRGGGQAGVAGPAACSGTGAGEGGAGLGLGAPDGRSPVDALGYLDFAEAVREGARRLQGGVGWSGESWVRDVRYELTLARRAQEREYYWEVLRHTVAAAALLCKWHGVVVEELVEQMGDAMKWRLPTVEELLSEVAVMGVAARRGEGAVVGPMEVEEVGEFLVDSVVPPPVGEGSPLQGVDAHAVEGSMFESETLQQIVQNGDDSGLRAVFANIFRGKYKSEMKEVYRRGRRDLFKKLGMWDDAAEKGVVPLVGPMEVDEVEKVEGLEEVLVDGFLPQPVVERTVGWNDEEVLVRRVELAGRHYELGPGEPENSGRYLECSCASFVMFGACEHMGYYFGSILAGGKPRVPTDGGWLRALGRGGFIRATGTPVDWLEREYAVMAVVATGGGVNGRVLEVAVLDRNGAVRLERLVHPGSAVVTKWTRGRYGIGRAMVRNAGAFPEVWPEVREVLDGCDLLLMFDLERDLLTMRRSLKGFGDGLRGLELMEMGSIKGAYDLFRVARGLERSSDFRTVGLASAIQEFEVEPTGMVVNGEGLVWRAAVEARAARDVLLCLASAWPDNWAG